MLHWKICVFSALVAAVIAAEKIVEEKPANDVANVLDKLYFADNAGETEITPEYEEETDNAAAGGDEEEGGEEDEDESPEELAELLSQRVAAWCRLTGQCGALAEAPADVIHPSVQVGEAGAKLKRSANLLSDFCKQYKNLAEGKVPIQCRKREFTERSDSTKSRPSKRAASSLRDLCKFYGMRCKRGQVAAEETMQPKHQQEEEAELYDLLIESFFEHCRQTDECNFRQYLDTLNADVRRLVSKN